jgi:hypothetical protein
VTDGVGVADAADPLAGFRVGFLVDTVVDPPVGDGLSDGCGFAGDTAGRRWVEVLCQANATNPPSGTLSASTLTLEYTQFPDVPSDQNRPQYASAGGIVAQFASVGRPSTLQTTAWYCWSRVSPTPALVNTAAAVAPLPHRFSSAGPIAP